MPSQLYDYNPLSKIYRQIKSKRIKEDELKQQKIKEIVHLAIRDLVQLNSRVKLNKQVLKITMKKKDIASSLPYLYSNELTLHEHLANPKLVWRVVGMDIYEHTD